MKVCDLEYFVSSSMRCHVFRKNDVTFKRDFGEINLKYQNDIFDDYFNGIKFYDLQRYKFVWNAEVNFMEPRNNSLYIVINIE